MKIENNLRPWQVLVRILATVMIIDKHIDAREHKEIFYALESWIKPGYVKSEKVLEFSEEIYQARKEMGESQDERIEYVKAIIHKYRVMLLGKDVAMTLARAAKKVIKADNKVRNSEKRVFNLIQKELIDLKKKHDLIHGKS